MLKLTKQVDISNSRLLVSSGVVGFASIISTKILSKKHNFEKIGFYFSEYLSSIVTVFPEDGIQFNGEAYFDESKKILLLVLSTNVPKYFTKKFFDEFDQFVAKNSISNVLFFAGIVPEYQNDSEITSKTISTYYISNDDEFIGNLEKGGAKSFKNYCDLKSKKQKPVEEVHYASGIGLAYKYIKHQNKNKLKFNFIGAYIRSPLDILAGLTIYNTIAYLYGYTDKPAELLEKKYDEIESKLKSISEVTRDWLVLTKLDSY